MYYYTVCKACYEKEPPFDKLYKVIIDSDLIGEIECSKGHKSIVQINHFHFDVLFQSALYTYLSDFYSESLMSFAASLERVFEFYIKVSLIRKKVSLDKIDLFWKELNNSSERQYGAFCIEYLSNSGRVWKNNQNQVSFRNKVIHKGYVANSKEVKSFAQYCLDQINIVLDELGNDYDNEMEILKNHQESKRISKIEIIKKKNGTDLIINPYYGGGLNFKINNGPEKDIDVALKSFKKIFDYLMKQS